MKTLTTIVAGLFLLFTASSFTPAPDVSATIKAVFENSFAPKSEVKWTKYQDISVATFKDKGSYMTAAYDEEGNLLVVGKYVSLSQLPENAAKTLQQKYTGYAMYNSVIEMTTDTTWYLVDVQNEKYKLRLRCDASGSVTVESRTKK
ncbi:MAG TPA: hypothetical protein VMY77_02440 [Chitinophagaceae bacterium]|nr:hypothetical protein [Chitinophagaceae bacterium]